MHKELHATVWISDEDSLQRILKNADYLLTISKTVNTDIHNKLTIFYLVVKTMIHGGQLHNINGSKLTNVVVSTLKTFDHSLSLNK